MFNRLLTTTLTAAALAGLAATPALAAPTDDDASQHWLSLSGEVAAVSEDSFLFDYGEGLVRVEMDDWEWFDEDDQLRPGERVSVSGRADEDFFRDGVFDAEGLYAQERKTLYTRPPRDMEKDIPDELTGNQPAALTYYPGAYNIPRTAPEGTFVTVSGKVTAIDGRNVILDTGPTKVTVSTMDLHYNPLDKIGHQQVGKGDYIRASGQVDGKLLASKHLTANEIVTLRDESAAGS